MDPGMVLEPAAPPRVAGRTGALARAWRQPPATNPSMRHLLGWSYIAGSVTATFWVALPNQLPISLPAVLLLTCMAWVLAIPLARGRFDHLGSGVVDVVLAIGNLVLMPAAIVLSGEPDTPMVLFYLWSAPYAFLLLPLRRAALHVVAVAVGYAAAIIVLWSREPDRITPWDHIGVWLAVTASVAAVGLLIRVLLTSAGMQSARFAAAFHGAPEPAVLTEHTRIVDANAAFTELMGVALEDARGRDLATFVPDLDAASVDAPPDGPVSTTTHRFVLARPSRLHDGQVLWQLRDETARLEAERGQQRLRARLVAVDDAVRARLATRLHDDAIQRLAATELRLLRAQGGDVDPTTRRHLDTVAAGLEDSMTALREVLSELHPPTVGGAGLEQAILAWVAAPSAPLVPGLQLDLDLPTDRPAPWHDTAYRIITEALANVARHARASQTLVVLRQDHGGVHGLVSDDGVGLDGDPHAPRPGHLGMSAMADRAELAGGWCRVRSSGAGTVVEFWLPDDPPTPS